MLKSCETADMHAERGTQILATFHGEKSDFLLKMWCFGALLAHTKSTHKMKISHGPEFSGTGGLGSRAIFA